MKYILIFVLAISSFLSLNGQLKDLEIDLVANYMFTGNAEDISGYLNHGIVHGATLVKDRCGNDASAYYFDGINDYISVPDADILSFPDQKVSIALWINPYSPGHTYMVYKGSNSTNREYAMGIRVDGLVSIQINNQGNANAKYNVLTTTSLNLNEWYHLVMTWDGTYLSIFVNGAIENRLEYNASLGDYNSDLIIGTYIGDINLYAYHGIIDDIFIYKRVLHNSEIEALYSGLPTEER